MQWSEAEAVVRAYRTEHGMSNDIDVATLARVLGTDVTEVRRLAGRKPRFIDRSGLLSAGIACALAALVFAVAGPSVITKNPIVASLRPAPRVHFYVMPAVPHVPAVAQRQVFVKGKDGWMRIETGNPVDM